MSSTHTRTTPPTFPVLIVGGFGLPAQLYTRLARELDARIAPTGLTIGCGEVEARKVERALEAFDEPVALVGHSRGGQLARVVAARKPEAVRTLVTVGTPSSIGPPQRWGVPMVAGAMRRLRLPFALDCADGECCTAFRADLARPVEVPWTAIWSPTDRIVTPSEARHEGASLVEVKASHVGLVTTGQGRAAVEAALA